MQSEERQLKKSLGLFDSTAIVMGSMIGSGIFIVSADMSRNLGSPGWLLVAWLLTGVLTIFAALSYGELAAMMPKAGGQYVYLREAYNPMIAFLYGWTLFLVIQTGTIAAVGMAFAKFFGVLVPWFSETNIIFQLGFLKINTVHLPAILSIVLLTYINTRGINIGKIIQNFFTYIKFFVLIIFVIAGLLIVKNTGAWQINTSIFWQAQSINQQGVTVPIEGVAIIIALGTAMVGSLFSSDAWNNLTFTAGEVINPKKNIPLSLFLGTIGVTIIYILANIVYIKVLPLRGDLHGITAFQQGIQFASNDRVGSASMSMLLGENAAFIMAAFIMISTFGCNNGLILAGARVYYAMAADKLFFSKTGELNRNSVPSKGLVFQCIWACMLCLSGTYSNLLDYVIFAVLIFYVLTIAGVFILRIKKPDAERPYKTFGYPYIPVIYIILASTMMVILFIYKPNYSWPGLVIVLLGVPVYYIRKMVSEK